MWTATRRDVVETLILEQIHIGEPFGYEEQRIGGRCRTITRKAASITVFAII